MLSRIVNIETMPKELEEDSKSTQKNQMHNMNVKKTQAEK